jgi:hypothetical protein
MLCVLGTGDQGLEPMEIFTRLGDRVSPTV